MDEQYVYDATNRMTLGTNNIGETSEYVFNGLGHLVRNVWTVKQNAYGYTGITNTQIENSVREDLLVIADPSPSNGKNKKDKMDPLNVIGMGNPLNKTTTIIKNFVIDYTSPLKNVIMETETGGFTYRYVYGLEKLSVLISPVNNGGGSLAQNKVVKLYYHQDRLGSVDYLSDNVLGEVASYIDYDEWGAPLKKRVLKLGNRELDMAVEYTGHPWDAVLGLYYARARMYDANDRRWPAQDLVRGTIASPITLNRYAYVVDNPVRFADPWGLERIVVSGGVTQEDYSDDGPYELFKYQFIETALKDISDQRIEQFQIETDSYGLIKPEKITWMVVNYGYSTDDIIKFENAADHWGIELIMIEKKEAFINYINSKSISGGSSISRYDDPITYLSNYSHGLVGYLGWGYNSFRSARYNEGQEFNFYINDIKKLDSNAFSNPYCIFFSCNTGTKNDDGVSFAQEWANKSQGTTVAVVGGKTNFININIVPRYDLIGQFKKSLSKLSRQKNGFSYIGSVNYPSVAIGAEWYVFMPE